MISESERFNIHHPDLCPSLRWKGLYILAELVRAHADLYWARRQAGRAGQLLRKKSRMSWYRRVQRLDNLAALSMLGGDGKWASIVKSDAFLELN